MSHLPASPSFSVQVLSADKIDAIVKEVEAQKQQEGAGAGAAAPLGTATESGAAE